MIEGNGFVFSIKDCFSFDILEYPNDEMVDDFDKALESKEFENLNVKVFRVNFNPVNFMGQAVIYKRIDIPECTYAICVSGYLYETPHMPEYKDWLYRHELRHCIPKKDVYLEDEKGKKVKSPFRFHDINLKDLGNGNIVGFFWEDLVDISCCDKLMMAFRNTEDLEKYL